MNIVRRTAALKHVRWNDGNEDCTETTVATIREGRARHLLSMILIESEATCYKSRKSKKKKLKRNNSHPYVIWRDGYREKKVPI